MTEKTRRCMCTKAATVLTAFVMFGLVGCVSSDTSQSSSSTDKVSRGEFGDQWPLTVESGEVGCVRSDIGDALTFTGPDGTVYALNGTAGTKQIAEPIRPIWADDPATGLKKDLLPLMEKARASCR